MVQTQRCKVPSPTLCVFVTYIRSRSGRSSIAPFPMQNIVAKTTQQRTIARDDVSLVLTLTDVSCSLFIVSRLSSTGVREIVRTGVGTPCDEVLVLSWSRLVLVLVSSCLGLGGLGLVLVLVLSWSCLGLVLVLSWSCLGLVLVLSWSCLALILVLSCLGFVFVLSWFCLGLVLSNPNLNPNP
jgi:hypothetical protein